MTEITIHELIYPRGFADQYVLQPWLAWGRVARPYRCRNCGQRYPPALSAEIDDRRPIYLRETEAELLGLGGIPRGARLMVFDRTNAYRFCREPSCSRFYDYARGDKARSGHHPEMPFVPMPRQPMRRSFDPMPRAANSSKYTIPAAWVQPRLDELLAATGRCVPRCPPELFVEEPC